MRRVVQLLGIAAFSLFMAGCGGQNSAMSPTPNPNPTPENTPVSMSVTDTPPTGVTVLFFQLGITDATLTTQGGTSVPLLSSSHTIPVNVTELQTDAAFLGNANLAAGDYTGLTLTFSNPQLTIFNGTGATIGSGATACVNNATCTLSPSTSPMMVSFTTAPFPIDLSASSPLAFMLDINLNTVIQSDLTVNLAASGGVTLSQLPIPPTGPVPGLGHVNGTIQSVVAPTGTPATGSFVIQTPDGRTFTIDDNGSTTYNYPSAVCSTANAACLAAQQVVKVEVSFQTGGTLLASEVDYIEAAGQTVVEGDIIRLSSSGGNTVMDLILNGPYDSGQLPMGHRATVTVPTTGVTYAIDSDEGFTIPSGLSFASATDLNVGQEVAVAVMGSVTTASGTNDWDPWGGRAKISFTTDSITLEPNQITGQVNVITAGNLSFTLNTNPYYFVTPSKGAFPSWAPITITVLTTSGTTFDNFTTDTFAGVAANDRVSIKGWVFSTPSAATNITIAAEKVREHQGF